MSISRLEAVDVSVSFAGLDVLDCVHLALPTGEVHGLIGPNGAGKSTLLNVLSGYVRPTAGAVRLNERAITHLDPTARARLGIARTFQAARVFPRMTVLENVWAAACAGGLRRAAALARARELLEEFALTDLSEALAGAVAYGVERRIALARALAGDPRFLLLDEPAAGLDEAESAALGREIRQLRHGRGIGVLVVEHDVNLILANCEVVHVLAEGRLLCSGTPEVVVQDPAVRQAYLGIDWAQP